MCAFFARQVAVRRIVYNKNPRQDAQMLHTMQTNGQWPSERRGAACSLLACNPVCYASSPMALTDLTISSASTCILARLSPRILSGCNLMSSMRLHFLK